MARFTWKYLINQLNAPKYLHLSTWNMNKVALTLLPQFHTAQFTGANFKEYFLSHFVSNGKLFINSAQMVIRNVIFVCSPRTILLAYCHSCFNSVNITILLHSIILYTKFMLNGTVVGMGYA